MYPEMLIQTPLMTHQGGGLVGCMESRAGLKAQICCVISICVCDLFKRLFLHL